MENERIEQFANQIKENNRIKTSMHMIYLYVIFFVWFTYCFVMNYGSVEKEHIFITCIVFMVVACSLILYYRDFLESYVSIVGKGGKMNQDVAECVARMPFSANEYMACVSKRLQRNLLLISGGMIVCLLLGLLVYGRVDNVEGLLQFQWGLPSQIGKAIGFLGVVFVCMCITIILIYYFLKKRYHKIVVGYNMTEQGKRKHLKALNIVVSGVIVVGVVVFLVACFVFLFQDDPDPLLTIFMFGLVIILVVIKYWYIWCSMGGLILVLTILIAQRRRQGRDNSRIFKLQTVMLHMLLFGLGEAVFLFGVSTVLPVYQQEESFMYETTDWLEYGYFSGHYEGEEEGRYSGLFIFPEKLSAQTKNQEYFYGTGYGMFGSHYEIYFNVTYPRNEFEAEKKRLSDITCHIPINVQGKVVTNSIHYNEDLFNYPAYISVYEEDNAYEYALIDEANCRIVYVSVQYCDGSHIPEEYLPKGGMESPVMNGFVMEEDNTFNMYYAEDEDGILVFYKDVVESEK